MVWYVLSLHLSKAFELDVPTGLAPLFLTVSESQLQTIAAVGAGLLIGTALGVILPEGSEAFRTAQEQGGNVQYSHPLHTNSILAQRSCKMGWHAGIWPRKSVPFYHLLCMLLQAASSVYLTVYLELC